MDKKLNTFLQTPKLESFALEAKTVATEMQNVYNYQELFLHHYEKCQIPPTTALTRVNRKNSKSQPHNRHIRPVSDGVLGQLADRRTPLMSYLAPSVYPCAAGQIEAIAPNIMDQYRHSGRIGSKKISQYYTLDQKNLQ